MMKYQNDRGGTIVLQPIDVSVNDNHFKMKNYFDYFAVIISILLK